MWKIPNLTVFCRYYFSCLAKLGNEKKISNLGKETGYRSVSPLKINFWQYRSKLTQKHIPRFSGLVQFCLIFTFFCDRTDVPCLRKLALKTPICPFKVNFGTTKTNWDMQNSMFMFTFSLINRKYLFWSKNLVQSFKFLCFKWLNQIF